MYLQTLARTLLLCLAAPCCLARPTNLQEQNVGQLKNLFLGIVTGFETFVALMGYDEEDGVKENMDSDTLEINPADEHDQTEIKIAGLGLGRTGSTSLVIALEILGYSVVHDDEQTELTDLYDWWEEEEIDTDEFHEILGKRGFNATFKTAGYRWVARHPEIKAILTVRDNPDKFVDSWLVAAPFIKILERPPFCWMETVTALMPSFEAEFRVETTGGNPKQYLERETLRANYINYNKRVQEAVSAEQLLTFNVKQGWGPLCEFLDLPIPEEIPFPHVHTRAKLQGEMLFLEFITWIWPLAIVIPLVCFIKIWNKKIFVATITLLSP